MDFEYTDHEYLAVCTEGCGELTQWLQSKYLVEQAIKNHAKEKTHICKTIVRMKPDESENRPSLESKLSGESALK